MKPKNILQDLAPGCYELTDVVNNPSPDKRVTRNWTCAATWAKGTRLYVRKHEYGDILPDIAPVYVYTIENIDVRWAHMCVGKNDRDAARWNALAAAMEPVDETLEYLIHRLDCAHSLPHILGWLVKTGKVALADIEFAYNTEILERDAT